MKRLLYIFLLLPFSVLGQYKGDTELISQYITSIITFDQPYAYFDNNGIIINPQGVVFEGIWAKSRLSGLLPVDYEPPKEYVDSAISIVSR